MFNYYNDDVEVYVDLAGIHGDRYNRV